MVASYASLNGSQVFAARALFPWYGAWVADVQVASDTPVTGTASLVIGDLTLTGTFQRADAFAGSISARIVAGFGGWNDPVQARTYQNPNGILASMILKDAASELGEQVNVIADSTVGTFFIRENAPGSRLLKQVGGDTWWIDSSQVTQVGPRTNVSPITSPFIVTEAQVNRGVYYVATENLADWMPARTFSSPTVPAVQTISAVALEMDRGGQLRLEVISV